MSTLRLEGKVGVVTGSSSGLGRAIALGYAKEGAYLVCADLQPKARAEVEQERGIDTDELIRSNGGRAVFVKTDVSKSDEVEALVTRTVLEYGRLDV
jgi:NAD(P)-dependent dehydrogenase (short-subunit alcohol dehydrogenase family)